MESSRNRLRHGIRVALVGDPDPAVTAHRAIPEALALASAAAGVQADPVWVPTTTIPRDAAGLVRRFDAVWVVPASPYANTDGVLAIIRSARLDGTPFLGTCGGFQHALIEIARGLWDLADAASAEDDPGSTTPVITPLSCGLVEVRGHVTFKPGSRIARCYGRLESEEGYHCRYGLNPLYVAHLESGPLRATAWDDAGEVRAVELDGDSFFVATLFQPERAALAGRVPPLATALLQAAARRATDMVVA